MSILTIPGGTFDDDRHIYRDSNGIFVPSTTQIINLQGLSNGLGNADPEDVANASRRGQEVHFLAFAWARYGSVDPTMVTEEVEPYYTAYRHFLEETGFVPDPEWSEKPTIATVYGMKFGVTPDNIGARKPWPWIMDLKCTAQESKAWAIQTAAQEIGYFGQPSIGQAKRGAVILRKNGTYKCCRHEDHNDAAVFLAALTVVYRRMRDGQKLWEMV